MIKIAIVEDEVKEQQILMNYLRRYEKEIEQSFSIECYQDGADIVENFGCQYDIIFCDIQMQFMDGIRTAEEIRKKDSNVILIFITNLAEFAIQGYEVDAIGYILKPLSYTALARYLKKALKHIEGQTKHFLSIQCGSGLQRIPLEDVMYIECVKHYQYVHTKNGVIKLLMSLKSIEEKLPQNEFSKCNSGCIVHLSYVQKVEKNSVYIWNQELGISRNRKKEFMENLTEYMGEK